MNRSLGSTTHKTARMLVVTIFASALASSQAQNAFSDGFEGTSVNPFWTFTSPFFNTGSVSLDTGVAHSGTQSVKLSTTGYGDAAVLTHNFPSPVYGTVEVYVHDPLIPAIGYKQLGFISNSVSAPYYIFYDWGSLETYLAFPGQPSLLLRPRYSSPGWRRWTVTTSPTGVTVQIDGATVFTDSVGFAFNTVSLSECCIAGYANFDDFSFTPAQADQIKPTVSGASATPNPAATGTYVTLSAHLEDTGSSSLASWQYSIQGVTSEPRVVSGNSADVSAGIGTFAEAGVYPICVSAADVTGNVSDPDCFYLVIYKPDGGFVTGGGWINSPAGAYAANPALAGKAIFGFNAKYQPGATIPTGQTEFQFKVADLNFKSTAYEWLVVAGARAQFKGTGTINGAGSYGFMLSAIDGGISGGGGVDRFRIKISGPGGIVYDNQMGASDTDDPSTALGGGSIVIHKP